MLTGNQVYPEESGCVTSVAFGPPLFQGLSSLPTYMSYISGAFLTETQSLDVSQDASFQTVSVSSASPPGVY